jgi:thermitase
MENIAPTWSRTLLRVILFTLLLVSLLVLGMRNSRADSQSSSFLQTQTVPQDGDGETKLKGYVVSRPEGDDGIGTWVILTTRAMTKTVMVDSQTGFGDKKPIKNSYVEVKGTIQTGGQPDGVILAKEIKLKEFRSREVVVRLKPGVIAASFGITYGLTLSKTVLASGDIYLYTLIASSIVTASSSERNVEREIVSKLSNDAAVEWAELNYSGGIPEGHPYRTWRWGGEDPTGYINQHAFDEVELAPALQLYRGDGLIIAVLDTGIDLNHPAFEGRLIEGYDMVADDAVPQDEGNGMGWGHGTHVAGIITHMAPDAKIMPVRVLDTDGRGNVFTLAYAIEWAVEHGADVINLSLGTDGDSKTLADTIRTVRKKHNVIIIAAAGNDDSSAARYPVSYNGVIGVTAVDENGVKADFANYGRESIDLAAPGMGITSTIIGPEGSGYASWNGTSMAAAFVSGAAALAREKNPGDSPEQIQALLTDHGKPLDALNPKYIGKVGSLLNVAAALVPELLTPTPTGSPEPTATPTPTTTVVGGNTPTPTTIGANTPVPTSTPTTGTPKPTATSPGTGGGASQHIYLPLIAKRR